MILQGSPPDAVDQADDDLPAPPDAEDVPKSWGTDSRGSR
jgi:hypothetical protein